MRNRLHAETHDKAWQLAVQLALNKAESWQYLSDDALRTRGKSCTNSIRKRQTQQLADTDPNNVNSDVFAVMFTNMHLSVP